MYAGDLLKVLVSDISLNSATKQTKACLPMKQQVGNLRGGGDKPMTEGVSGRVATGVRRCAQLCYAPLLSEDSAVWNL